MPAHRARHLISVMSAKNLKRECLANRPSSYMSMTWLQHCPRKYRVGKAMLKYPSVTVRRHRYRKRKGLETVGVVKIKHVMGDITTF